ncbi:pPIWI_RE_Y domain-containing protein [Actinoplanes sichuanensis]|uniref:REase associating with pPIWI RE domain-containing protein n=1 Tax=Actinoplanes sichuanensis TaxID=512349 RepID=A0ABW4A1K9_9ACTN|nr:hypothetical protein [Actinoplanes sichuanensis]
MILALITSGLMRLPTWIGPEDSRTPYPTALQQGFDHLTWACWMAAADPPTDIGDLVTNWCTKPLSTWPLEWPDGAIGPGDQLVIDGEPTETCRDWAVSNPDVISEVLESAFMRDVRSTCRSMGPPGQTVYVALRRLLIDSPTLTGLELLSMRNTFPDLPSWSDWLSEAYEPAQPDDILDGNVGVCRNCDHLVRHTARSGWRCATPRCQALPRPPQVTTKPAKGVVKLRRDLSIYISLPGRPEADLARALEKTGATVLWWPDVDVYDLLAIWPDGRRWGIDVKDWRTPYALARRLRPLPSFPTGHEYAYTDGFVVIPDDRTRKQRNYLHILRRHSAALREQPQTKALSVSQLLTKAKGPTRGA